MKEPANILLVRNDKLGDFMLAWPALAALRQTFPHARISVLVPDYTAPIARMCPSIDKVLLDPGASSGTLAFARQLREERFDVVLTLFSTTRVGIACWLAGIRYRIAPATKLAQLFYNHRLVQRRSRSEKPEHQYNLELVERLCRDFGHSPEPVAGPYLQFPAAQTAALRERFCADNRLPADGLLIMLHAGSGGSAANLSERQFGTLLGELRSSRPLGIILSAGPGERQRAEAVAAHLDSLPHCIFDSSDGLEEFSRHIAMADLFIAGSTGPLHIAGALDVATAGFYSRRRSATPLRWQTLNRPERRLAFTPAADADEMDMGSVDIGAAAKQISAMFLNPGTEPHDSGKNG